MIKVHKLEKKVKKIPYVDLGYKKKSKVGLVKIFKKVLNQGQFVGGQEILKFEQSISK